MIKPKYPVKGFLLVPKAIAHLANERVWCLLDRDIPIQRLLANAYIIGLMDATSVILENPNANMWDNITTA